MEAIRSYSRLEVRAPLFVDWELSNKDQRVHGERERDTQPRAIWEDGRLRLGRELDLNKVKFKLLMQSSQVLRARKSSSVYQPAS